MTKVVEPHFYVGPNQCGKALHALPRVDFHGHHVSNEFPIIDKHSHASKEYVESLVMVAAIPAAILVIYLLHELLLRFCQCCCCRRKEPEAVNRLRAKTKLRTKRANVIVITLAVVAVFLSLLAFVFCIYTSQSVSNTLTKLDRFQDRYDSLRRDGHDVVVSARLLRGQLKNISDNNPELPNDIQEQISQARQVLGEAASSGENYLEQADEVNLHSGIHQARKHSKDIYGSWSWLAAAIGVSALLTVIFLSLAMAEVLPCLNILIEVLAVLTLFVSWALVCVQMAASAGISDACMKPITVARTQVYHNIHSDNTRTIIDYYLLCEFDLTNPLNETIAEMNEFIAQANTAVDVVLQYAQDNHDEELYDQTVAVVNEVDTDIKITNHVLNDLQCAVLHNMAIDTVSEVCHPFLKYIYIFVVLQGLAVVVWLIARACITCRCCPGAQRMEVKQDQVAPLLDQNSAYDDHTGGYLYSTDHIVDEPRSQAAIEQTPQRSLNREGGYLSAGGAYISTSRSAAPMYVPLTDPKV